MPVLAQHILVALIVLAAAAYLGRMAWKSATAKSGCGCAGKPCARIADMSRAVDDAKIKPEAKPSDKASNPG